MVTREEYENALRIIEQYEREQLPDMEDDDFAEDEEYDPLLGEWENCTCGAYQVSSKTGKIIKLSDCLC